MSPSLPEHRLYRLPQRGMIKGVCAGIADYFSVPVTLVRAMAVLSVFCGLFIFTLLAYGILAVTLPVAEGSGRPRLHGRVINWRAPRGAGAMRATPASSGALRDIAGL
ncbi:PspC domain-containing protein [Edwardsiella tarda]|uniref:PspC domain-containing protein n=1 Tax=Edwardsiella tarda TaxID=636 RepID=UPI00351C198E